MELIVISDSKLKIMLTGEDMNRYSIDCNTLSYDNTETRRAFWSILDEVKHKTGFDAANEKVFVQVYPSKGGGCEMYVTKLGIFSGEGTEKHNASEYEDEYVRIKEGPEKFKWGKSMKKNAYIQTSEKEELHEFVRKRALAYKFDCIENLISACRRLSFGGFSGESSAYGSENSYYLLVGNEEVRLGNGVGTEDMMKEYGEEISVSSFEMLIGEHCRSICKAMAVEILSKL